MPSVLKGLRGALNEGDFVESLWWIPGQFQRDLMNERRKILNLGIKAAFVVVSCINGRLLC